jgi:hypothetical protein
MPADLARRIRAAVVKSLSARNRYTDQMVKGTDYVDSGWFGQTDHPAAGNYFYLVTAYNATGETAFDAGAVVGRDTAAGEMNRLSWLPVSGATG